MVNKTTFRLELRTIVRVLELCGALCAGSKIETNSEPLEPYTRILRCPHDNIDLI